jgi:hypothetical protein
VGLVSAVREQAIEAGARAAHAQDRKALGLALRCEGPKSCPTCKAREPFAAAVFDAVEPIIRADERWERLERIIESGRVAEAARAEVRERLRAQVEGLPHDEFCHVTSRSRNFVCDCAIADVLALLGDSKQEWCVECGAWHIPNVGCGDAQ